MSVQIKRSANTIILDVNKRTTNPLAEVLAALSGIGPEARVFVDMTGIKPSKLEPDYMERLLTAMNLPRGTYIVGLPDQLVGAAEGVANTYGSRILDHQRPKYIVANKDIATRIANQH